MRQRGECRLRQLAPKVSLAPTATSALRKPVCASVAHIARADVAPMSSPLMRREPIMRMMMSWVSGSTRSGCSASQPCASMYSRLSESASLVARLRSAIRTPSRSWARLMPRNTARALAGRGGSREPRARRLRIRP
eukprot:2430366-Prymnesium_polylepis.1